MKKFIYKIVIFSFFPIFYFGLCGVINYYLYSNQDCGVGEHTILAIGDSHVRRAINPDLFYSKALNVSQPGEPYILSFWKLKKIFKTTIPDTLIVGFARHNISVFNDYIFSDLKRSAKLFKRSYPIQEFMEIETIKIDYIKFLKVLWEQTCWFPKPNHCTYIGAYFNLSTTNLSGIEKVITRHYYSDNEEVGISNTAISYLDSILYICQSNGVVPVLVNTPVHETYNKRVPMKNNLKHKELTQKLKSEGVIIIDKSVSTYPDSLFYNVNHLNERGSNRFTRELIEILNKSKQ